MENKKIKKEHFAQNLSKFYGFPLSFSKKIIDDLLKSLKLNLRKNSLNLKNLGTFKVIEKKERYGRNPKTGEIHLINSRKSVSFTASKKLIKKINS